MIACNTITAGKIQANSIREAHWNYDAVVTSDRPVPKRRRSDNSQLPAELYYRGRKVRWNVAELQYEVDINGFWCPVDDKDDIKYIERNTHILMPQSDRQIEKQKAEKRALIRKQASEVIENRKAVRKQKVKKKVDDEWVSMQMMPSSASASTTGVALVPVAVTQEPARVPVVPVEKVDLSGRKTLVEIGAYTSGLSKSRDIPLTYALSKAGLVRKFLLWQEFIQPNRKRDIVELLALLIDTSHDWKKSYGTFTHPAGVKVESIDSEKYFKVDVKGQTLKLTDQEKAYLMWVAQTRNAENQVEDLSNAIIGFYEDKFK